MPTYHWLLGLYLGCLTGILIFSHLSRMFVESPVPEEDVSLEYKTLVQVSRLLSTAHRTDRDTHIKEKILECLDLLESATTKLGKKMLHLSGSQRDMRSYQHVYHPGRFMGYNLLQPSVKYGWMPRTIEILAFADSCRQAEHLVSSIHEIYSKIRVHLGVRIYNRAEKVFGPRNCGVNTMKSVVQSSFWLEDTAEMWIQLAKQSQADYLLIGRNMVELTEHTNLNRMWEVLQKHSVDVLGGAVKLEPEGRWFPGCYQMALRNFTVRITPGYDLSDNSCAYCDYVASPILIRRQLFLSHMNRHIATSGVAPFVDLFLRLKQLETPVLVMTCVDVLFTVSGHQNAYQRGFGVSETPKSRWLELAQQWQLNRILLPGGLEHQWSCREVGIKCSRFLQPALLLPPCCLQELADALKTFVRLANAFNISTCLFSGNIVGAVKLYSGLLPWERDSDIGWDAGKWEILAKPMKKILVEEYGYSMGSRLDYTKFGTDIRKCREKTQNTCIYYGLKTPTFNIELYGEPFMVSEVLEGLQNPTSVNVDGMWMPTVPNPGRVIRHQFGDNVLRHIQHWRDYRVSTSWASAYLQMQPVSFLPCPHDAPAHACPEGRFSVTGNIQFQDVVV